MKYAKYIEEIKKLHTKIREEAKLDDRYLKIYLFLDDALIEAEIEELLSYEEDDT